MMDASSVSIPIRQGTPHRVFALAILLKGLNGSLELIAGFGLLLIGPNALRQFVTLLTARDMAAEPQDMVASHLRAWFAGITPQAHAFATIYLLLHGIVKLVLVIGLLRGKAWAYPAATGLFTLFITYMGYRLGHGWSASLAGIMILDMATVALVLHEWRCSASRVGSAESGSGMAAPPAEAWRGVSRPSSVA